MSVSSATKVPLPKSKFAHAVCHHKDTTQKMSWRKRVVIDLLDCVTKSRLERCARQLWSTKVNYKVIVKQRHLSSPA